MKIRNAAADQLERQKKTVGTSSNSKASPASAVTRPENRTEAETDRQPHRPCTEPFRHRDAERKQRKTDRG